MCPVPGGHLDVVTVPTRATSTRLAPRSGDDRRPAHLPQLDGVRTVAMTLVLVYHVARTQDLDVLPGGFVGVDLFFVLSGFLITSLLLREHRSTGRIDLRRFYVRRLWRLYPALILVSAVAAVVFAVFPATFGFEAASPLESVVALAYGMSWWSGLELPGGPYLLGLTWSLSVEEHFYLLWPVVLIALLRRGARVRSVVVVALLANAYTAVLWHLGADPDRLYYMADTRFAQLLTGCALAAAVMARPDLGRFRALVSAPAATASALAIAAVALTATRYDAWYWSGGMQVIGVGGAVVIGHLVVHRDSRMASLLRWGPLPTLGVWSYGIYLWHLPLIRLAQPVLGETLLVAAAAGLASIPVAAASYRYVEQPLQRRRTLRLLSSRPQDRDPDRPAQRERELQRAA
jgi:peptidoglycan/LPS O-acetylase OafA/YrhL